MTDATESTPPDEGNSFLLALEGKERLALVWWGFGIPLKLVSWALNSSWAHEILYSGQPMLGLMAYALTIAASIVFTVMAWRCAPNVEEEAWTWVARAILVGNWLWLLYQVFGGAANAA